MVQMPSPAGGPPADWAATGSPESSPKPALDSGTSPTVGPPIDRRADPELNATTTRLVVGVLLGAGAAAFGGWILGEYPFTGVMPYITGVLFALVVTEIMLSISRRSGWVIGIAGAVASAGGIGLAVWIQSTEGLVAIPIGGWMAIAIGGVVALLRGALRGGLRRGARPRARS